MSSARRSVLRERAVVELLVLRRGAADEERLAGAAEHLVERRGGHHDLARLRAVEAADDAAALHHVYQARGACVADLELPLDHRGGGVPGGDNEARRRLEEIVL